MRIVVYIIVFAVLAVALAMAYVRLSPTDAARWHQPVQADESRADESRDFAGGALRVLQAPPEALAQIDTAARALPRTKVVAGSVAEGRITYETRSALWGFPDYTTVEYDAGTLRLYARLRFGASDLGVNAKRLEGLLAAIQ